MPSASSRRDSRRPSSRRRGEGGAVRADFFGSLQEEFTWNPELRLFHFDQRRYTQYAVEPATEVVFNGALDFGGSASCTLPRGTGGGEMFWQMYLRVTLPPLAALDVVDAQGRTAVTFQWVRNLAYALVAGVDLGISQARVDSHDGTWMRARALLVSDRERLSATESITGAEAPSTDPAAPLDLLLPLQFFMNEDQFLAMPAPYTSEVRLNVKLRPLSELLVPALSFDESVRTREVPVLGGALPTTYQALDAALRSTAQPLATRVQQVLTLLSRGAANFHVSNAAVLVNVVRVDPSEARRLAQHGWHRVVECSQANQLAVAAGDSLVRVDLTFNVDVFELVWYFVADADARDANAWTAFTDAVQSAAISFDNRDRVSEQPAAFFDQVAKMQAKRVYHPEPDRKVHAFSFSLSPNRPLLCTGMVNLQNAKPSLLVRLRPGVGAGTLHVVARYYSKVAVQDNTFYRVDSSLALGDNA